MNGKIPYMMVSKDNKKIIGFSGGYFGGGNCRVIYEYLQNFKNIRTYWVVSDDKKELEYFKKKGYECYDHKDFYSDLRLIPLLLETDVFVGDVGTGTFLPTQRGWLIRFKALARR